MIIYRIADMVHYTLTLEQGDDAIRMFTDLRPIQDIASLLKLPYHTIKNYLIKRLGEERYEAIKNERKYKINPAQFEHIRELIEKGNSLKEIYRLTGRTQLSIVEFIKRTLSPYEQNRLLQLLEHNRKKPWSKKYPNKGIDVEKILAMFRERKTVTEISVALRSLNTREIRKIIQNNMSPEEYKNINDQIEKQKKEHRDTHQIKFAPVQKKHIDFKKIKDNPYVSYKIIDMYINKIPVEKISVELGLDIVAIYNFLDEEMEDVSRPEFSFHR